MDKLYDNHINNVREIISLSTKEIPSITCKSSSFFKDFKSLKEAKDNINAEIYEKYTCFQKLKCGKIILKITPLVEEDANDYLQGKFYRSSSLIELYIFKLLTELYSKKVCPNLPYIYRHSLCLEDCSFTNKEILRQYPGIIGCNLLFTPKAQGTLKHFLLSRKKISVETILSIYFQIFIGIYVLYNQFSIEHHDLHYKNVLYIKTPNNIKYYTYKIKDDLKVTIKSPWTFYLWDFGIARFNDTGYQPRGYSSAYRENKDKLNELFDFDQIVSNLPNKYMEAKNILKKCINKSSTRQDVLLNMIPLLPDYKTHNAPEFDISKKIRLSKVSILDKTQTKEMEAYKDSRGYLYNAWNTVTSFF